MFDSVAIYSPHSTALTIEDFKSLSNSSQVLVEHGENGIIKRFTIKWPKLKAIVTIMPSDKIPKHLRGYTNFLQKKCVIHDEAVTNRLLETQYALGIVFEPGFDNAGKSEDFIQNLMAHQKALLFRDGHTYDSDGNLLASPSPVYEWVDEEVDLKRLRLIHNVSSLNVNSADPSAVSGSQELPQSNNSKKILSDDSINSLNIDPMESEHFQIIVRNPPSFEQRIFRLYATAGVVSRAFSEIDEDPESMKLSYSKRLRWLDKFGFSKEFFPKESSFIHAEIGKLSNQIISQASWKSETLLVLEWSMKLFHMPAFDNAVNPGSLFNTIRFMKGKPISHLDVEFREPDEIKKMAQKYQGLHWRLKDFLRIRKVLNFKKYSKLKTSAEIDMEGIPLIDDDLAIKGVALISADDYEIKNCQHIVIERLQTLLWLLDLEYTKGFDLSYL